MENIALAEPGAQLSIWALFIQASWVVKLVMIGLLCASIWTWAIIVDKLVAYGRMRLALNRFEQVFWSGQSLEELYRTLADRKTTGMGAIFVAAMREWKKSFEKGAKSPLGLQTRIDKAMAWNEVMMPMTVPNRPMKGAAEPVVARKPSRPSSRSISRVSARSIALSMRVCRPSGDLAPFSKLFFHSRMAATKIAPMPVVLRSASVR